MSLSLANRSGVSKEPLSGSKPGSSRRAVQHSAFDDQSDDECERY